MSQRLEAGLAPDWFVDAALELPAAGAVDEAAAVVAGVGADAAEVAVALCEGYGVGNSPAGGISPLLGELQPANAAMTSMAPKRRVIFMIALRFIRCRP